MCWLSHNIPEKCIASSDVVVYKLLIESSGVLCSPIYESFSWEIGKVISEKISLCSSKLYPEVYSESGFHSCLVKPYSKSYRRDGKKHIGWFIDDNWFILRDCDYVLYECIIPRGGSYYVNEHNEVVSNKLKLVKRIV